MTRAGRLSSTISQGSSARLSAGIWPMASPMALPISIATTKEATTRHNVMPSSVRRSPCTDSS